MLDELDAPGAPVEERVLSLDDLYEADEVFITSTTRELLPVSGIRGQRLRGGDGPWPVMETLRTALAAYMRRYVQRSQAPRHLREQPASMSNAGAALNRATKRTPPLN